MVTLTVRVNEPLMTELLSIRAGLIFVNILKTWFTCESYFAKINHSPNFGTEKYISYFFSLRRISLFLMLDFGKKEKIFQTLLCSRYYGLGSLCKLHYFHTMVILCIFVHSLMHLFLDFERLLP